MLQNQLTIFQRISSLLKAFKSYFSLQWLGYCFLLGAVLFLLPTACTNSSKMVGNISESTILSFDASKGIYTTAQKTSNQQSGELTKLETENRRLKRDSLDFEARLQSCRNFNMELINKTGSVGIIGLNKRMEDLQVKHNSLLYENNYLKKELERLKKEATKSTTPVPSNPPPTGTATNPMSEASYLSVVKSMFSSHTGSGAMRVHIPYWGNNIFDIYIVDLKEDKIDLYWKNRKGKRYANFANLQKGLQKEHKNLVFATNGGMFSPNMDPVGLYIENGLTLQPIDLSDKPSGNFYMKPNGIFMVEKNGNAKVVSSNDFAVRQLAPNALFATQSGPMLVTNGNIHPKFQPASTSKRLRSGVGIINSQKAVFVISHKPVNFYHFAKLFRDYLGCSNALYLDGTISQMHIPELNRMDRGLDYGVMIGVTR